MTKYCFYQQLYSLLLLFVFTTSCNGQNPIPLIKGSITEGEIKDKTTDYGPSDIVQCMLKDKAGNLWFGMTGGNGVFRYDGKVFINFTTKDGLCNNDVGAILEDKTGKLWFCTDGGICRYDGKTFTDFKMEEGLFSSTIFCIMEDKTGNIWFGTEGGVLRHDGKTFSRFLSSQVIKCILEDKTGHIWAGSWSNGGVYRSDNQPITDFINQNGISDNMVASIGEDENGSIWVGTRDRGVCHFDGKFQSDGQAIFTNFSVKEGLCNNNIYCIMEDKMGVLWFGSTVKFGTKNGGVCRYDGKTFTNFSPKEGLENNDIFCSVEDKEGNLWFGGRYGRLFRYDGQFTDFSKEVHKQ
jgi:ligand-binding sensor domain-containing protein